MADGLEAALGEYFTECDELLQNVSMALQAIEKQASTPDTIDGLYRDIHTIKGTSQLFGFKKIGEIAHAMEASLEPIRDNKLVPGAALVEALYRSLDAVDKILAGVKAGQKDDEFSSLVESAVALLTAPAAPVAPAIEIAKESPALPLNKLSFETSASHVASAQPTLGVAEDMASSMFSAAPVAAASAPVPPVAKPAPVAVAPAAPAVSVSQPVAMHSAPPAPAATPQPMKPAPAVAHAAPPAPAVAPQPAAQAKPAAQTAAATQTQAQSHDAAAADTSSIRVPVSLLDRLMTLMGEMVLVRNQVLQYANKTENLEFLNLSQRLDVVTSEIQGEVMKTRMQPIGNVLSKFQRVIRDLARDLNKKIDLVLSGTETELDKTLLEAVKDPIMHIVRNSCDHGLELPQDRRNQGKPETGTITIKSYHEGGHVIVEIIDDGRGLQKEKLLNKAIEKGLLTKERALALTDSEVYALIFAPGFSTAAAVTNVSGRGVGMDVVKNNIEGIGGLVEIKSQEGKGTTTRLKIPLTLAIVPAMIVRCQEQRFAIAQNKLVELVRVEKSSTGPQIEILQGRPMYRLRGNLLPLVNLTEVLTGKRQELQDVTNIVVLNADGVMFGLILDEVQDTAEVVVKPLSTFLKSLSIYSGATVLGDGSVALILDVSGIAQKQKLHKDSRFGEKKAEQNTNENQEFLLFRVNTPTKHALPLNLVHRLEEFNAKDVELTGDQRVVRYRNTVMPLITMNAELGLKPSEAKPTLSVVVVQKAGRVFGIEVDEILDVLATQESIDDGLSDRPGILGNLVTQDELIVILDTFAILEKFVGKMTKHPKEQKAADLKAGRRDLKILFAEDTAFFRKHVTANLTRVGFNVVTADNGAEAFKTLDANPQHFDLILSDIEMPKMNGLEFAKAVRADGRFEKLPMIALTTKFAPQHVTEGKQAGFNEYLEKLNVDVLLNAIDQLNIQRKAS